MNDISFKGSGKSILSFHEEIDRTREESGKGTQVIHGGIGWSVDPSTDGSTRVIATVAKEGIFRNESIAQHNIFLSWHLIKHCIHHLGELVESCVQATLLHLDVLHGITKVSTMGQLPMYTLRLYLLSFTHRGRGVSFAPTMRVHDQGLKERRVHPSYLSMLQEITKGDGGGEQEDSGVYSNVHGPND